MPRGDFYAGDVPVDSPYHRWCRKTLRKHAKIVLKSSGLPARKVRILPDDDPMPTDLFLKIDLRDGRTVYGMVDLHMLDSVMPVYDMTRGAQAENLIHAIATVMVFDMMVAEKHKPGSTSRNPYDADVDEDDD